MTAEFEFGIDARLWSHTGIGTVIRCWMPALLERFAGRRMLVLAPPGAMTGLKFSRQRVEVVPSSLELYTLREAVGLTTHANRCRLFWSPHYVAPLFTRARKVVTVHDVGHLALERWYKAPHRVAYARLMLANVRRTAAAVTFVSAFSRDEFIRLIGAPCGSVTVTPCGVDEAWFHVGRRAGAGRPYLLFVGNVKPNKNLSAVLAALHQLGDTVPHKLVVVGQRSDMRTVDNLVLRQAEALGDRVEFTGFVPQETLFEYFRSADALVFPSTYEGFGLPPLEAMAAGCPVMASAIPTVSEVCGSAARYFDPLSPATLADAIRDFVADPARTARMVELGRKRAREYHAQISARRMGDVIESTL